MGLNNINDDNVTLGGYMSIGNKLEGQKMEALHWLKEVSNDSPVYTCIVYDVILEHVVIMESFRVGIKKYIVPRFSEHV